MRDVELHVYGNTAILEYKLDLTHFAGDTAHLHEIMVWLKSPRAGRCSSGTPPNSRPHRNEEPGSAAEA